MSAKKLITNFFSLSSVEVIQHLINLATLPYLTNVVGAGNYGSIMFTISFAYYFTILTNYGFNLTATKDIARNRGDKSKLENIYSSVMFTKLFLLLISFFIMLGVVFTFKRFEEHRIIYFFGFTMVVGQVIFPIWFFQGMEKMKFIAIFNLIAKLIFTGLIFWIIQEPDDFIYAPLVYSSGMMFVGFTSIVMIWKKFGVRLRIPSFSDITGQLKGSFNVFISEFSPNLYNNSSIFILGFFATNEEVGAYSLAMRIMSIIGIQLYMISNTIYPHLANSFDSFDKLKKIMLGAGAALTVGCILFADLIMLLFKSDYSNVPFLIRLLSISMFLISVYLIFGPNNLLIKNRVKIFRNIVTGSSIFGFFLVLTMIYFYGLYGAIAGYLTTRLVIAILMYFAYRRNLKREKAQICVNNT